MWPSAILFDLDDTLFDHRRASAIALEAMHAAHAPDLPFGAFANGHADVLEVFHRRFLAGEFNLDEARIARMRALFARFDRQIDTDTAERAARLYRDQHQANRRLVAGAKELLEVLRGRCRLGIVTNNSVAEQMDKLRALDISSYFDAVVISEAVGVTKPDPEIFAIALDRIGAQAQDAVFIGDNWTNDIEGALVAGMTAIWLDRDRETPAPTDMTGEKCLDSRTGAGDMTAGVVTISALAPAALVLAAIRTALTKRTPGAEKHEQLETLAT